MLTKDYLAASQATVLGGALALAIFLVGCGKPAQPEAGPKADAPAAPAAESADFGPLKGRWVRQDGDYMIEIKSVGADGKLEAGYFNPRPIHVGKAEAEAREGRVRVFDPAKTVADCFKYRNKIGLDVAPEALRDVIRERKASTDELWRYAKICRVANVLRPYMEALL